MSADQNFDSEKGSIKISDDVISVIAGLAATEVEGVAGMSGGVVGDITEILGRKNLSKGVKVAVNDKNVTVDLYIIVDYGVRIPEVAWNIQENVKKAIENMTGLSVTDVNIHVQGVSFGLPAEKENDSK
ncbi:MULTISPECIES: Asp23/Gls24 family envelope stress response protein [Tepidanaerobacter]|uniref:Uncharacterized conserved protein YloU, alkaline shock protein (Asp25) family n=1 Tax=Tepidanaerobacter syntrophicus TaxID=224999 RepID=A0A0U9HHE3_9FIRM|nr:MULTISPECIES: Asp23/Gls24 family envelope stress response protein [Tepidanaerobacter]GAQ26122.1 uncharacterized conserved protein YloU, alkaline shock protein (Asp25) family [Tepidanaerobacter syntrophicus]GLI19109.1 alkaline-shock protein [Tepidanaerobacter syntrophicus]GLI50260.1 alkaline-shock protein [Tepidanaerobacter syntrophicus]HHV82113.1 Asp23/Gls24 family envelope stress response protein [Tepidanaerobacter syntrophicus]